MDSEPLLLSKYGCSFGNRIVKGFASLMREEASQRWRTSNAPVDPSRYPYRPDSGWAFSTLGCPGASAAQIIRSAQEFKCRGIELRFDETEFLALEMSGSDLETIQAGFRRGGILIVALTTRIQLCTPSHASESDDQLDSMRAQLKLAHALGAPGIRVFMNDDPASASGSDTPGERLARNRLQAVQALCSEFNIHVLIETHDSHASGKRLARFFDRLGEEIPGHFCRIIWDAAHTWVSGETPTETLDCIVPWLAYLQIKDVRSAAVPFPVLPGTGTYPIDLLTGSLRERSWVGWAVFEWERRWHPQLEPLDQALAAASIWACNLIADVNT
jgi:sugar phosphate isomerase/epimerase